MPVCFGFGKKCFMQYTNVNERELNAPFMHTLLELHYICYYLGTLFKAAIFSSNYTSLHCHMISQKPYRYAYLVLKTFLNMVISAAVVQIDIFVDRLDTMIFIYLETEIFCNITNVTA